MLQLLQQQGRQPFCSLLEQVEGREFPSFLMLKPQEPRVGMETGREAALRCAALRCAALRCAALLQSWRCMAREQRALGCLVVAAALPHSLCWTGWPHLLPPSAALPPGAG